MWGLNDPWSKDFPGTLQRQGSDTFSVEIDGEAAETFWHLTQIGWTENKFSEQLCNSFDTLCFLILSLYYFTICGGKRVLKNVWKNSLSIQVKQPIILFNIYAILVLSDPQFTLITQFPIFTLLLSWPPFPVCS